MITMTVNAQPSGRWLQCIRKYLGSCLLPLRRVVLLRFVVSFYLSLRLLALLIDGTNLDNFLNRPRTMQIQTCIDEACAHASHENNPLLGSYTLKYLLEEIIPKWVNHGLSPEGQSLSENCRCRWGAVLIECLLEKTTTHLIPR
jgi:hypothetical protein